MEIGLSLRQFSRHGQPGRCFRPAFTPPPKPVKIPSVSVAALVASASFDLTLALASSPSPLRAADELPRSWIDPDPQGIDLVTLATGAIEHEAPN